jgi:Uncharacterized protein conserved in bacteria (DUF2064)
MAHSKAQESVIAVCIQEPVEEGSSINLGAIKGDSLRFLHQAMITDTIVSCLSVDDVDVRLYHVDDPDRSRLVGIICDYLKTKMSGPRADYFSKHFSRYALEKTSWGKRIQHVFADCFKQGYKNVLVIGSRTPTVTPAMMQRALRMLKECDVVFGPTPEGRYYIIGMSGELHVDMSSFNWKSPAIYSDITEAFNEKDLAWSELEIWYCIESMDEIEMMVRDINQYRFEGNEETARETEVVMERILARLEP